MDRTARAALLAGVIAFAAVAGLGVLLFPGALVPSIVAGLVVGLLAALLIIGAARRADSLEPPATPVKPSHPGPPDPPPDEHDTDEHDSDEDDRV